MRHAAESRGRRPFPVIAHPLTLTALGLLAAACLAPAGAAQAGSPETPQDTARHPTPFHFRKTVFFSPEYLSRVMEGVSAEHAPSGSDTARASRDEGAARFARRYGITRDLAQKIMDHATAEGVDPELGFRLIRVESRFKPRARGPGGSLGLLQLMPSTARAIDRSLRTEAQILDPSTNLRTGFRYLRRMIDRYDGDVRLGLLAYNRGEHTVDRALRNGRDPENGYSHKVLGTRGSNPYRGKGLLK